MPAKAGIHAKEGLIKITLFATFQDGNLSISPFLVEASLSRHCFQ